MKVLIDSVVTQPGNDIVLPKLCLLIPVRGTLILADIEKEGGLNWEEKSNVDISNDFNVVVTVNVTRVRKEVQRND